MARYLSIQLKRLRVYFQHIASFIKAQFKLILTSLFIVAFMAVISYGAWWAFNALGLGHVIVATISVANAIVMFCLKFAIKALTVIATLFVVYLLAPAIIIGVPILHFFDRTKSDSIYPANGH